MTVRSSVAENPWVRLLLGPAMAIAIVGFGIYHNDKRQDGDIAEQTARVVANEVAISKLSQLANELPLLRQALERDNELFDLVIDGLKRDLARLDSRFTTYIEAAGARERALQERIRELERREHGHEER